MNCPAIILFATVLTLLAGGIHGQEPSPPADSFSSGTARAESGRNPRAGGLAVEGLDEELRAGSRLTITFPAEMVTADKIDAEGVESPIAISPALDAAFTWRTQSQGELTIEGPLIPGQAYSFRVAAGVKDLAGRPLSAEAWGFELTTPELRVIEEDYGERANLNARPQVAIEFNFPVRISDAASRVWFQDRASRARFPVEILLNSPATNENGVPTVEGKVEESEEVTGFRVRPLGPLPVGRRYDLVVDGICDAYGGRPQAYPQVFPLGTTRPMTVDYVAARNLPLGSPCIEAKFNQILDERALPKDALAISPPVSQLRLLKQGSSVVAEGDFDPKVRYVVQVSPDILSAGGYGISRPETWGATFRPKESAILFPDRQIRQRSALGLNFAFYQVNTSELEWKLASVPFEKLPVILAREQEFNRVASDSAGNPLWTREGTFQRAPSEPLVPAFQLNVVAAGKIPAEQDDKDTLRQIAWKPSESPTLSGPMLLEVTGTDFQGRVIGNRAIIYFGEVALTRKVTKSQTIVRAARLSDAEPMPKATVSALDKGLRKIAEATTDPGGLAIFDNPAIAGAEYFLCGGTLQPVKLSDQFPGGTTSGRAPAPLRARTLTDRPLYRPGQSIQFKGIVREEQDGALKIPAGKLVHWTIERAYQGEVLASGNGKVDLAGAWNGIWMPTAGTPVGDFVVKALIDGRPAGAAAPFQIQEFRNPPFSVICENGDPRKPGESSVSVRSQYFHGAPNAGSRVQWTATWVSDSDDGEYYGEGPTRVDLYSEYAKHPEYSAEVSGEAALDGDGGAVLQCEAPFTDPGNRAECSVIWKVDITGPDGQTITGGTTQKVAMAPVLLGIRQGEARKGAIEFLWDAEERFGQAPESVDVKLFRVETKSVKERLARDVYRFRNFDQYELVEQRERVTTGRLEFTPGAPGRYVVVVSPPSEGGSGFPVSEQAFLEGDEESHVPIESDTAATVFSVRGERGEGSRPWLVGEKAGIEVLSPKSGVAWVSIETDRILDTFSIALKGNTSRLEIPVKSEYEPNAFVSVYILSPGGSSEPAGEMFGYDQIAVRAPERALDVSVSTSRAEYEPREKVSGEVRVKAAGRPVEGADLAIYAVDDSILILGGWRLPQMLGDFYPARNYGVATYSALKAYADKVAPSWLTMKGFVAGDAGAEEFGNVTFTRKEFKPLLFWRPSVRTDAQGIAKFECEAPENLTRFRVVAVGQTRSNQFGTGDATFAVSKKLLLEPALPRFLREGDEVELRAVARQKASEGEKLLIRCIAEGNVELLTGPQQEVFARRDAPAVVCFKARAKSAGPASVKFEATSTSKLADAVEVKIPVVQAAILKKEATSGPLVSSEFAGRAIMPEAWKQGRGTFDLTVSSAPWLNKLMGLPFLLEYPHGCFEQKSSRLLAYTFLGALLDYLPDGNARKNAYRKVIDETLREFETALLPDGRLPYWPGGTEANDFVTIQAAWCVSKAEEDGFEVPERLSSELSEALVKMVAGQIAGLSPTLRAFAIFALSNSGEEAGQDALSAVEEIFLQRDKLTWEGRAMLAIALHRLGLREDRQRLLVSELPKQFDNVAFNPETFSSSARTEAVCGWARFLIDPSSISEALRNRLDRLMDSSSSLSTQENFWLLVGFQAMLKAAGAPRLGALKPSPATISANAISAAWRDRDLARLGTFSVNGLRPGGSFVLAAEFQSPKEEKGPATQGIRIDRVVRNLTALQRNGSKKSPFRLGDQILISFRFSCEAPQSYVALEDLIPAGLEVVNPDLALFGQYYSLPEEFRLETARLSHSEIMDKQTNLYFDDLPARSSTYSVLARATAAGTFAWPSTQISPMYDSRFFGRSAPSECCVALE